MFAPSFCDSLENRGACEVATRVCEWVGCSGGVGGGCGGVVGGGVVDFE